MGHLSKQVLLSKCLCMFRAWPSISSSQLSLWEDVELFFWNWRLHFHVPFVHPKGCKKVWGIVKSYQKSLLVRRSSLPAGGGSERWLQFSHGSAHWLDLLAAAPFLSGKVMFVPVASKYSQFSPSSQEALSCCWIRVTPRWMSPTGRGREAETAHTHKTRNTELEELQKL